MNLSQLLYEMHHESDNVKHYRGDLMLDAAKIAGVTAENAEFVWITRECGTHLANIAEDDPAANDMAAFLNAVREAWSIHREYRIYKVGNDYTLKLICDCKGE